MKTVYGVLTKSDRAIAAEEEGKVTYTRLASWQKRAVDAGAVLPCEWHHTGAAANRTWYYDPEDFIDLDPADYPVKKVAKAANADIKRLRISVTYKVMVGGYTRRAWSKWETWEVKKAAPDVRKKDNKIIGAGGRRLSSKNESVTFWYLPPRCRVWREISKDQAIDLGYVFA